MFKQLKALRLTPMKPADIKAAKPLPPIPEAPPAQSVATDMQTLERVRAAVQALNPPPPHLFRALLVNAMERVYARKTNLLQGAAEIKRESDAAMTRILLSGIRPPASPSKKPTLLERIQREE